MRRKVCLLLVIGLTFSSCTVYENRSQSNSVRDYTFLIYMNGSDLESEYSAGTDDLQEMMKIGSNENINIVIETGGTKRWKNYYIDSEQNQRWLVKKNTMEKLMDLGPKNMGESDTLEDFIVWGVDTFPAEKYALILWNHGGGAISGFGYDENYNYDTLLLVELEKALKSAYDQTDTKFEFIGFDACLMASLETATLVSPYTNYLIGSTELEPSIGWEYSSFLKSATEGELNGAQLGKEIADGFYRDTEKKGLDDMATLSVIDTTKVDELKTSFERFVNRASEELSDESGFNDFATSVGKSEYYGGQTQQEGYSNMIDLGDLANNLSDNYKENKRDLMEMIDDVVVYKVSGRAKEDSSGISVYFPYYDRQAVKFQLPIYSTVDFSKTYNEFLYKYTDISLAYESFDMAKEDVKREGDGQFRVQGEKADYICSTSIVLGKKTSSDTYILYGGMPLSEYDSERHLIKSNFNGRWICLNDHMVYSTIARDGDNCEMYSIPVILNGEYANIRVVKYSDSYEILGAWHGITPDRMVIRKEIIKLKKGDTVVPILKEYNSNTKEEKSVEGSPFVLETEPKVFEKELPRGEYQVSFCISDYLSNHVYSEFTSVDK